MALGHVMKRGCGRHALCGIDKEGRGRTKGGCVSGLGTNQGAYM